ncbi:MAG: hypothetical protein LBS19_10295 [Clostridiales bacterium]|jgi:hypothetical protein|nr:hypothetical protein [Clostridiales bacterium]
MMNVDVTKAGIGYLTAERNAKKHSISGAGGAKDSIWSQLTPLEYEMVKPYTVTADYGLNPHKNSISLVPGVYINSTAFKVTDGEIRRLHTNIGQYLYERGMSPVAAKYEHKALEQDEADVFLGLNNENENQLI